MVPPEEITFDANVFLLTRAKAREIKERSTTDEIINDPEQIRRDLGLEDLQIERG